MCKVPKQLDNHFLCGFAYGFTGVFQHGHQERGVALEGKARTGGVNLRKPSDGLLSYPWVLASKAGVLDTLLDFGRSILVDLEEGAQGDRLVALLRITKLVDQQRDDVVGLVPDARGLLDRHSSGQVSETRQRLRGETAVGRRDGNPTGFEQRADGIRLRSEGAREKLPQRREGLRVPKQPGA